MQDFFPQISKKHIRENKRMNETDVFTKGNLKRANFKAMSLFQETYRVVIGKERKRRVDSQVERN